MTDAGWLRLFYWARKQAPDLLRALMASFLTGHAAQSIAKKAERRDARGREPRPGAAESGGAITLRQSERELIARVLSESKTLAEAASKLGIGCSTLWRKRKRYRL
jgi:transcriptional regulator with PAS, ATPase and Fis domain